MYTLTIGLFFFLDMIRFSYEHPIKVLKNRKKIMKLILAVLSL